MSSEPWKSVKAGRCRDNYVFVNLSGTRLQKPSIALWLHTWFICVMEPTSETSESEVSCLRAQHNVLSYMWGWNPDRSIRRRAVGLIHVHVPPRVNVKLLLKFVEMLLYVNVIWFSTQWWLYLPWLGKRHLNGRTSHWIVLLDVPWDQHLK